MIRRWSRINVVNYFYETDNFFFLKYRLKSFKKVTLFKKLTIKNSKFKRKSFGNLKHKLSVLFLQSSLSGWTLDFMFTKRLAKHMYFYSTSNLTIGNDSLFFFTWQNKPESSTRSDLITYLKKKDFFYLISNDQNNLLKAHTFFKNYHLLLSYPINDLFFINPYWTPTLLTCQQLYYPLNAASVLLLYQQRCEMCEFLFNNYENLFFSLILFKTLEYYKILSLLWINNLF